MSSRLADVWKAAAELICRGSSAKCAESQLTPLLPDRPHHANTNCSWPYVCVSSLDWINFRRGLCPGLLQGGVWARMHTHRHTYTHSLTQPSSLFFFHCTTHFFLWTSPGGLLPQWYISSAHHEFIHTHLCSSHISCKSHTVAECLEKCVHIPLLLPCVSPLSVSGGVISDTGLIINSIKRVWLLQLIGLG